MATRLERRRTRMVTERAGARQGVLKRQMDRLKEVLRQRVKTMKRRRGKP